MDTSHGGFLVSDEHSNDFDNRIEIPDLEVQEQGMAFEPEDSHQLPLHLLSS